jgi:hypothetical protein
MKSPSKPLRASAHTGPKSAATDEVDDIFKLEDPVEASIEMRKKAGSLTSTVDNKNSKQSKFFFSLKVVGEPVKITEEAKYNNAKELG